MLGAENKFGINLRLAVMDRRTSGDMVEQMGLWAAYFKADSYWAAHLQLVAIARHISCLQILLKDANLLIAKQSGSATG